MSEKQIEKYHFLKNEPTRRQFDVFDLEAYQSKNAHQVSVPHTHSFYQIIWFKNGEGRHFIDFESHEIKKDRLFFIAKNQVHYFEERSDYKGFLIHFNESFILNNETDINFFMTYTIFNNKSLPYFQIPKGLENQIGSYFNQIKDEVVHLDEFGNSLILSGLLKALLLVVEREKRKVMDGDQDDLNRNDTYLKFRDLLEHKFYQNWPVLSFAEELGISPKSLNAIVKSETDKTTSQVVSERIILEAKRKLVHTNSHVNEIAYQLGFQDPYYFMKYFKKHVSCSPSEFRKQIS